MTSALAGLLSTMRGMASVEQVLRSVMPGPGATLDFSVLQAEGRARRVLAANITFSASSWSTARVSRVRGRCSVVWAPSAVVVVES